MDDREILTLNDIAREKGVARGTVDSWRSRGQLPEPDVQVGRTPGWYRSTIFPRSPDEIRLSSERADASATADWDWARTGS